MKHDAHVWAWKQYIARQALPPAKHILTRDVYVPASNTDIRVTINKARSLLNLTNGLRRVRSGWKK